MSLKICKMGHYYPQHEKACPYCPKPNSESTSSPVRVSKEADKTEIFRDAPAQGEPTVRSDDKTVILTDQSRHQGSQDSGTRKKARKIVAWMVTFDRNPYGVDFQLFEGRNTIGSAPANDIVIDFDNTVSAKHLTILFRANEFLFQDELSTNGTYLNGIMKNQGVLKDGDKIKIAETEFLFRTAFI